MLLYSGIGSIDSSESRVDEKVKFVGPAGASFTMIILDGCEFPRAMY